MLNTKVILFPGHIQSVYYQNILKIITFIIANSEANSSANKELVTVAIEKMSAFLSSGDVEAQERVSHRYLSSNSCILKPIDRSILFRQV
jgi:AP-3 complex subunit delta